MEGWSAGEDHLTTFNQIGLFKIFLLVLFVKKYGTFLETFLEENQ